MYAATRRDDTTSEQPASRLGSESKDEVDCLLAIVLRQRRAEACGRSREDADIDGMIATIANSFNHVRVPKPVTTLSLTVIRGSGGDALKPSQCKEA